jgi:hypothetical protein
MLEGLEPSSAACGDVGALVISILRVAYNNPCGSK